MARFSNLEFETVVRKDALLAIRPQNREEHGAIVAEARKGYVEKARKALNERMEQLLAGELVSLSFNLSPPVDCTEVYNTAIKMLEMHTKDEITLAAGEFRNLVEDEWDWSSGFYIAMTGTGYSLADPEDAGVLNFSGFDTSVPAVLADFARG